MAKSEVVLTAIKGMLSEGVSESLETLNESGDLKRTAEHVFKAASDMWDKQFKAEIDRPLKSLGFSRKSYSLDYKPSTFELTYENHKIGCKIVIYGSFFGGSSSSHYFYVEVHGPHGLHNKGEVEYFESVVSMAEKAIEQLGGMKN